MIWRRPRKGPAAARTKRFQINVMQNGRALGHLPGAHYLPLVLQALLFIFLGMLFDRILIGWQGLPNKDSQSISAPSPYAVSPRIPARSTESTPRSGAAPLPSITPAGGPLRYLIQPGDTLVGLSSRYRVTVQSIMDANGLTSDFIVAGEYLLIPQANAK